MTDKIIVKFLRSFSIYNAGEVAGFTEQQLSRVHKSVYERVNKPKSEPKLEVKVKAKAKASKKKESDK